MVTVPTRRALWLLRREHPCWRNLKVRTCKYLTTSLSKIIGRSSDAVRRWLGSNRSRTQPSQLLASNWRIEFARGSSRLAAAVGAIIGRGRRNEQWHSHRNKFGAQRASSRSKYPVLHQNPWQHRVIVCRNMAHSTPPKSPIRCPSTGVPLHSSLGCFFLKHRGDQFTQAESAVYRQTRCPQWVLGQIGAAIGQQNPNKGLGDDSPPPQAPVCES